MKPLAQDSAARSGRESEAGHGVYRTTMPDGSTGLCEGQVNSRLGSIPWNGVHAPAGYEIQGQVPPEGLMFHITESWIKAWQNGNGGWNREQLSCIGVEWPPRHGWIHRSVGRSISLEAKIRFEQFMGMSVARIRAMKKKNFARASAEMEFPPNDLDAEFRSIVKQ